MLVPQVAAAETCGEKLSRLMIEWLEPRAPATALMRVETKDQGTTVTRFLHLDADRYMVEAVEPADAPWYLTIEGTTWQSADGGANWTKAYSFNAEETRARNAESVRKQAASVENAVCGTEEIDGVMHDTIEADMSNPPPAAFQIHATYWINQETGFVTRTQSRMTMDAFESTTTQEWTPAPDLVLPSPQ